MVTGGNNGLFYFVRKSKPSFKEGNASFATPGDGPDGEVELWSPLVKVSNSS